MTLNDPELLFHVKLNALRYHYRRSTSVITEQPTSLLFHGPSVKLSTYGPRSFAVAAPTTWNSLPEYLRDLELSIDSFRRQLKTFLFAQY